MLFSECSNCNMLHCTDIYMRILGFYSYVAMVKLENAMTNPVMLVFVNLLIESTQNQPSCTDKNKIQGLGAPGRLQFV